jgi:hypothetical protein
MELLVSHKVNGRSAPGTHVSRGGADGKMGGMQENMQMIGALLRPDVGSPKRP